MSELVVASHRPKDLGQISQIQFSQFSQINNKVSNSNSTNVKNQRKLQKKRMVKLAPLDVEFYPKTLLRRFTQEKKLPFKFTSLGKIEWTVEPKEIGQSIFPCLVEGLMEDVEPYKTLATCGCEEILKALPKKCNKLIDLAMPNLTKCVNSRETSVILRVLVMLNVLLDVSPKSSIHLLKNPLQKLLIVFNSYILKTKNSGDSMEFTKTCQADIGLQINSFLFRIEDLAVNENFKIYNETQNFRKIAKKVIQMSIPTW